MPEEQNSDRRRAIRRSLFDTVQWTEEGSEGRTKARISDISLTGCYVDTLNPLPVGTKIRLRLKRQSAHIEVFARVARVEPNMGMGVHFEDLTPEQQAFLRQWLEE